MMSLKQLERHREIKYKSSYIRDFNTALLRIIGSGFCLDYKDYLDGNKYFTERPKVEYCGLTLTLCYCNGVERYLMASWDPPEKKFLWWTIKPPRRTRPVGNTDKLIEVLKDYQKEYGICE